MSSVLISSEKIESSLTNSIAYRIHYHSSDLHGKATESTGLVITPYEHQEGRKVLTWAHGTTGLGDAACPSAQPDPARELVTYFQSGSTTQIDYGIPGLQKFIDEGWIVVATDYQGLGTPGVHQYTVNRTNALDAVNIVHAAREMDLGAGTQFGCIGWSQGGGTAAAVAELDTNAYGDLKLVGTVPMSPGVPGVAVKLPETQAALAGGGTPTPPDAHMFMQLAAMVTAFPDTLSLDDVFTPLGKQIFQDNFDTAPIHHLNDILVRNWKHQGAMLDVKKDRLPVWFPAFIEASAGRVKPIAPVLVLIDGQDPNGPCPLPWQLGYIEAIKELGGDITSSTYPDDDHFSLPQSSVDEARTWLNAKF